MLVEIARQRQATIKHRLATLLKKMLNPCLKVTLQRADELGWCSAAHSVPFRILPQSLHWLNCRDNSSHWPCHWKLLLIRAWLSRQTNLYWHIFLLTQGQKECTITPLWRGVLVALEARKYLLIIQTLKCTNKRKFTNVIIYFLSKKFHSFTSMQCLPVQLRI